MAPFGTEAENSRIGKTAGRPQEVSKNGVVGIFHKRI
jgi:hypothetical protein